MNTIAIVTYNRIGRGNAHESGWHEHKGRRVLLLQNTRGQGSSEQKEQSSDERREQIDQLWEELGSKLDELDHVVVYVGANGSQRAITLAAQLPPEKVTFVGCDCSLDAKEAMVVDAGMGDSRRILCDCGGHDMLDLVFHCFLATGLLLPVAA